MYPQAQANVLRWGVLSCPPPASSDSGVPFISKSAAMPAGLWWGPMASARGSPLPAATALRSGLSPDQKKRDLCEQLARLAYAEQPSVTPAHISGWDLWTENMVALLQCLTLSHYTQFLKVWEGKGAVVLPIHALLAKPKSCQLANLFFKFPVSLFLSVLSPGSVFLGNSSTI